jgi:hypothetical protein
LACKALLSLFSWLAEHLSSQEKFYLPPVLNLKGKPEI